MAIGSFKDLFLRWPGNECLGLEMLRLKTITLLALLRVLRSSDIAPKSELFDSATLTSDHVVFSLDQLDSMTMDPYLYVSSASRMRTLALVLWFTFQATLTQSWIP